MNVLRWRCKLEIHQNMGRISCTAWVVFAQGERLRNTSIQNVQKKREIHVDGFDIHKEYLQFEKNVKLFLCLSISHIHGEKQKIHTHTISQEPFVCISFQL